jgi:hypothetical protein
VLPEKPFSFILALANKCYMEGSEHGPNIFTDTIP